MATNSKHTEGKLYIGDQSTIRADNGQEHVWQHETLFIYTGGNKANASRIVTMWNNWDDVILALNNLIDAAQGNNEYECDTTLQNAVEMAKGVLPVE